MESANLSLPKYAKTLVLLQEKFLNYFTEDMNARFVYHDNTLTFLMGDSSSLSTYILDNGTINIPWCQYTIDEANYNALVKCIGAINTMISKED